MGYVTREMIDRAKEMDLLTYLQTYEPQELVHFGGSTYCTREHDSLKISNGKWCWFSRGIGGRTALDYLIKVKEIPFTEAVERIVGRAAGQPPISCTRQQPEQTKTLLLPQVSRCAAHAVEYLHSRGIDYELIDFCIRTGRLYESYPHHNAVFVGKDKDGQPRYACLRGIGTDFKGEATGSDKRFSFSIPAEESSQVLYLFESAIDLLSFAAMAQEDRLPWRSQHLLSLAGVYQPKKNLTERHLPLALSQYLRDHREIQTIYLCLDNDLAGRSAADAIRQQLAGRYVVLDGFPCQGKDYNDWLCLRKGLPITRTVSKPERSIPSTLALLQDMLERQAASAQKTAERLGGIQSELQEAGAHIQRAGRTLLGRPEPEDAEYEQSRGLLGKAQTVIGRMRNSLSSMAARTAQLVDRLTSERETPDSRQSVKEALRDLQAEQKYGEDFHVPAEPVR